MRYPYHGRPHNRSLPQFGPGLLEGHLLDEKVVLVLVAVEEADDALSVNLGCQLEMRTCDGLVNYVADHQSCHSTSCASRVAQ